MELDDIDDFYGYGSNHFLWVIWEREPKLINFSPKISKKFTK